jgi:hypothetical protein
LHSLGIYGFASKYGQTREIREIQNPKSKECPKTETFKSERDPGRRFQLRTRRESAFSDFRIGHSDFLWILGF